MKVGASDQSADVGPNEKKVTFTVTLKRGPAELQTWFSDKDGRELCGAYFVYVRRLE
jgi:arylsulfatase